MVEIDLGKLNAKDSTLDAASLFEAFDNGKLESYTEVEFEILKGKTLCSVDLVGDNAIVFKTTDNETYLMAHETEYNEIVYVEDIAGNIDSLIGSPLLMAEETSNIGEEVKVIGTPIEEPDPDDDLFDGEDDEATLWTFYKLATVNGYVTIRWCGISDWYAVGVALFKID